MARTEITIQEMKGPFADITANLVDITFAAMDNTNGNKFVCTGREVIIFQNTDAGSQTVTIPSVADEKNRSQDITTYSLGAGEFAAFGVGLTNSKGWKQTSGEINLDCSSANIKVAVLRLPAGYP